MARINPPPPVGAGGGVPAVHGDALHDASVASLDGGGKVPTTELGGAGADGTKFLRGDQTWQIGTNAVHGDALHDATVASLDGGGKVPATELGGAGGDATKFLRGDRSWQFAIFERAGQVMGWDPPYNIRGDNATNNDAGLAAAKAALPAAGGDILLPPGIIRIADDPNVAGTGTALSITDKAYHLKGMGGRSRTFGDGVGTVLRYHGAGGAGTIAVEVGSTSKITGVDIDGNALAGEVVKVVDTTQLIGGNPVQSGLFDFIDCFIHNPRNTGWAFHPVTQYLGYVTDSDIHGSNTAGGRGAAWIDATDIIFRGVVCAKADPCLQLSKGGFRWYGGDCSGEGKATSDGGLFKVLGGNQFTLVGIYFGTYTGAGSTAGAMAACVIGPGTSEIEHGTFDHCNYTMNNPSTDGVHDYFRVDGSNKRVHNIRWKGGGARPIKDRVTSSGPSDRPSAERFRYFLNLNPSGQGTEWSHITVALDHVVLAAGANWGGLFNTLPTVVSGDTTVDNLNLNSNTETKRIRNGGRATFSGDGVTTSFTIPHGLIGDPTTGGRFGTTPGSNGARIQKQETADSTNITVAFSTPPVSGTNNVTLNWWADIIGTGS